MIAYETVLDGGDGASAPSGVTHNSTAQYTFTFLGWSKTPESTTVDASALKNVTADRHVYAVYQLTVRTYTVEFRNYNNTLLESKTVQYGANATYTGATPIYTEDPENFEFIGWDPELGIVTRDTSYTAKYRDNRSVLMSYLNGSLKQFSDDERHVTTVGEYGFYGCSDINEVNLPAAKSIGKYAFWSKFIKTPNKISIPEVETIGESAFRECKLVSITLPSVTLIEARAFQKCSVLKSVIITQGNSVAILRSNSAFLNKSSSLKIYVPDNLLDAYKEATNWSYLAASILPLSEAPDL